MNVPSPGCPRTPRQRARRTLAGAVSAGTVALVLSLVAPTPSAPPAAQAQATAAGDSLVALEKAVARDSTDARKRYRLGLAYLDRDRPQEAARQFQRAVESKPDYVEAWVNLGASDDAIGHGADARRAYEKALSLRPGDEIALCRLASSYYASGFKDSAMAAMRRTLEVHPRSHCTYFTMGVAYADAGIFREAIRAWEKVVEFAPDSPEGESARESIKLLQDYLGPEPATADGGKPGVPPGSGGPGEPIPGGGMSSGAGHGGTGAK